MRLYFQIMWFLILSSVTQLAFASIQPSRKALHRAARQTRHKRLLDDDTCSQIPGQSENEAQQQQKERHGQAKSHGTGIAMKAAMEAKQANDDMAGAVKIASDRIKLEYAEKAGAAAKAAEAVLVGKHQVLEQLEMEVREAEIVVQEESQELSSAEANSQLALKAHTQAQEVLKLSIAALKMARENFDSAELVSNACQQSMAEKTSLLDAAQKRVGILLRQLSEARNDFQKTKKAAYKALCAANEAKQRIDRAQG